MCNTHYSSILNFVFIFIDSCIASFLLTVNCSLFSTNRLSSIKSINLSTLHCVSPNSIPRFILSIGKSVLGKPIEVISIGSRHPRNKVRLVAGVDGRDWVNRELLLLYAENLAKLYASDDLTKQVTRAYSWLQGNPVRFYCDLFLAYFTIPHVV